MEEIIMLIIVERYIPLLPPIYCKMYKVKSALATTQIERPPVYKENFVLFPVIGFPLKHALKEPVLKGHLPVKTTSLISLERS